MDCPSCDLPYNCSKNQPKILAKCGHTMCANCITSNISHNTITCVQCSSSTDCPKIDLLPTNYAILSILDNIQHKNALCREHHKPIEGSCFIMAAYCRDTDEILCVECLFLSKYKNKDVTSIEKAYKSKLSEFKNSMAVGDAKMKKINVFLSEIEKSLHNCKSNLQNVLSYSNSAFSEIVKLVNKSSERISSEVSDIMKAIDDKYSSVKCDIDKLVEESKAISAHEMMDMVTFLSKFGDRKKYIKSLDFYSSKKPPTFESVQKSVVDKEIEELIKNIQKSFHERTSASQTPKHQHQPSSSDRPSTNHSKTPIIEKGSPKIFKYANLRAEKPNRSRTPRGNLQPQISTKDLVQQNTSSSNATNTKSLTKDNSKKVITVTRSKSPILKTDMRSII